MFGPYHLIRALGHGGMGEVYEAEHTVKGWTVAVKLMSESVSSDPVFRERMKREARIAGRLQEPHVVPIHDYGEIDGQMFLEMRLIEGTDLDTVLKRFGPLTPPRAVAIITQIASALDAAHAAGVMHRDVKPPNILVTRDDFAYLVDFGIASAATDEKLTQKGTAVGTWKYMAPERFTNDKVTYRADIYSLACVLYECLTGGPPYPSDSAGVLISAHMMDPIPRPSASRSGIPRSFDAVIARGMAKRPQDRYASAGDLARDAHEALSTPDQNRAETILRRSQESALPGRLVNPPTVSTRGRPLRAGRSRVQAQPGADVHLRAAQLRAVRANTAAVRSGGLPVLGPRHPPHSPRAPACPHTPQGPSPPASCGTPSGGPPPQQFAGAAPWSPPAPPRRRNPWAIVSGVAALFLVVILTAIGIWAATKDDDDARANGQRTTTTTTRTRPGRRPGPQPPPRAPHHLRHPLRRRPTPKPD